MKRLQIEVDGRLYEVDVWQGAEQPADVPRILIPTYLPTPDAADILRACLQSIAMVTATPCEIWVIDNHSPEAHVAWLRDTPMVCVALSRTDPVPPERRGHLAAWAARLQGRYGQQAWGSYANAIGLELGVRLIRPDAHRLVTLHMDTMVVGPQWLSFLDAKIDDKTAVSGVRWEEKRVAEGVVHVLGMMVDFARFRQLGIDFLPSLPALDVGDAVTIRLRGAGFGAYACPNSHNRPELLEMLRPDDPIRLLAAETAFDDGGKPLLLHLGRGLRKSTVGYDSGASLRNWLEFANTQLASLAGK